MGRFFWRFFNWSAKSTDMMVVLQNLVFWPLFVAASIVFISIATVVLTLVGLLAPRRYAMRRLRRTVSWYGAVVLRCGGPFVRVKYRDFAPQQNDGPYVFICNHRSASDPFLIACLPFELVQIVNDWPLKLPILGWVASLAGYIDIMNMAVEEFYERSARLLNCGVCIISFPEGTRSGSRRMGSFTSSVFRLALRCRATLVPLAISGSEDIPRKGSLLLHPGCIYVDKLPAVTWERYRDMDAFRLKTYIRDLLCEHLSQVEGTTA